MGHPVHQGRDLAEHFSPDGDKVAVEIKILVMASGAMQIIGPMNDPLWMLAALDHAKDAIKNQQRPKTEIIIPAKDVQLSS